MTLIFFCRLAADFSLYYTFANCILLFFSSHGAAGFFIPAALLLAAGTVSFGLKEKFDSRLAATAPLILPCLIPLLAPGWLPLLAAIPPWAYLVYVIYLDLERLTYADYHERFFLGLKLLPILILPLIISLNGNNIGFFQARVLPFVIFYLFSSILSLRLSRYRPETLGQKSAQLANMLLLAAFLLICFSIVYSNIWFLLGQFFTLLYRYVLAPVILLLALALTLPFFLLSRLIGLFRGETQADEEFFNIELGELVETGLESYTTIQMPAFLRYALIALVLTGVGFAVWRLFRKLAARGVRRSPANAVTEGRRRLEPEAGREIDLLPPSDPRQAIRYYYRRFLRHGRKFGLPAGPYKTSRDISAAAAGLLHNKEMAPHSGSRSSSGNLPAGNIYTDALASLEEFRGLYLPARYDDKGSDAFSKEDAGKARNHYRLIIKALSSRSRVLPPAPPDNNA
ncbi:MAG: hypothetical protein FWG28_03170 [Clostridiales bacterium]|nr:hypothetical protein [Clostridiales bacterium]